MLVYLSDSGSTVEDIRWEVLEIVVVSFVLSCSCFVLSCSCSPIDKDLTHYFSSSHYRQRNVGCSTFSRDGETDCTLYSDLAALLLPD